jgi:flagellar motor switch protein FliG
MPGPAAQSEGARKAAALLLAMGKPLADKVLKYFSDAEMRGLVGTMVTLGPVPREVVDELVTEVAIAFDEPLQVRGSPEDVERLLTGIVPPEQLSDMIAGPRSTALRPVWADLTGMTDSALSRLLAAGHPQIAAYILAKTTAATAADVLRPLAPPVRTELVRRVLAMKPVTKVAQSILEQHLRHELAAKVTTESGPPVHARVAGIINKMERQQMDEVLSDLNSKRPKDAKAVKGLLFSFEDIERLSPADRVKLFDGVPNDRTILALQGVTAALKENVLAAVSARARRMIEQELGDGANASVPEIAKARRLIADHALEMAERGLIQISNDDEPAE